MHTIRVTGRIKKWKKCCQNCDILSEANLQEEISDFGWNPSPLTNSTCPSPSQTHLRGQDGGFFKKTEVSKRTAMSPNTISMDVIHPLTANARKKGQYRHYITNERSDETTEMEPQ